VNKKIAFLVLLGLVVLPGLASAQAATQAATPTLSSMAQAALTAIVNAVGFLIVIIWVITGILFLTAGGAPEKLKVAKVALITAIVGTIIIIMANYATSFVGGIFGLNQ